MRKGQTLVIEYIVFFLISFSLFIMITAFFYNQNELFKGRVGERLISLINDDIAANAAKGLSCKSCRTVKVHIFVPSKIGGYYYRVELNQYSLNTTLLSGKLYFKENKLFNLNETFSTSGESKSENKIIEMQINNIDKQMRIS